MKRTLAIVILLAALGTLVKLAFKGGPTGEPIAPVVAPMPVVAGTDERAELLARYPDDHDLVVRTLDAFGHNARAIERTDGLRGLMLLDRLGLEAVYLHEKHPNDFRKLRDALTDEAAAEVLLHWREYFGLKAADDVERELLIGEIGRMGPSTRRVARRYPNLLPLLLAEPAGMAELVDRYEADPDDLRDVLVALTLVSLEPGPTDLKAVLRTFDQFGPLALQAFRLEGPDGLALVHMYGPVLVALGEALPLDEALILLRVNAEDVERLLSTRRPEVVAAALRHVAAGGRRLVEAVGSSPHGLRLSIDFGAGGDRALTEAGPDAADLVYGPYADADPTLKAQAVAALAEHGPMALALLSKYEGDRDFRDILRVNGPDVVPPVARADHAPEVLAFLREKTDRTTVETLAYGIQYLDKDSGQATIARIKADGLDRVRALESSDVAAYQFLPLYDLVHLGGVLTRGQAPTRGEMTWALVDGCFVVVDALSLLALQPEGAAASELARTELKAAAREGARAATRELAEEVTEAVGRAAVREGASEGLASAAEQASRWWAVRRAGGPFAVFRRLPEALASLDLGGIVRLAGPTSTRAGIRLSVWGKPLRFMTREGERVLTLQPGAGLRVVRDQVLASGVGVVGYRKMEEFLKSRRPGGLDAPES
jgi:hypothetical protein